MTLLDYLSKRATPADCSAAESRICIYKYQHAATNDAVCGLCHKEATFSVVVAFDFIIELNVRESEARLAGGRNST